MLDRRPDFADVPNSDAGPGADARALVVERLELPSPSSGRGGWRAALAVAVAGHAGLIAALLWTPPDVRVGAGGDRPDAIAVEIVPVTAMGTAGMASVPAAATMPPLETGALAAPSPEQAREAEPDRNAKPVPEPLAQAAPGPVLEPEPRREQRRDPKPETVGDRAATVGTTALVVPLPEWLAPTASAPDPALMAALQAEAAKAAVRPKTSVEPEPAEQTPARPLRSGDRSGARPAAAAAVPAAVSVASAPMGSEAVVASSRGAASPGALRAFGREVSRLLQVAKPYKVRGRGRVAVAFVIEAQGGRAAARVVETSGDGRLEAAALAAVRSVSFPVPPEGATLADRSFRQEYRFQ